MRRRATWLLATSLAAAAALTSAPASAAFIDFSRSQLRGGTLVEHDLGPGVLAFDPAITQFSPMRLAIVLEAGDVGAPLAFNALIDNLTGELWEKFFVRLEKAIWDFAGSATANASSVVSASGSGNLAEIVFGPPGESAGLDLGAALGTGEDWRIRIDPDEVAAGETFFLILSPRAVPEPATGALLALGLAALAARRRR